jgi:predicted metalloprotease with PDZ domain
VDTLIRQQTGNKSLDDFCKLFHGAPSGPPEVKTYTLDDVVAALDKVVPYGWKKHLEARVESTGPRAPLAGLQNSGWRLVYVDEAPDTLRAREEAGKFVDLTTSIGVVVKEDGSLVDVIPGMAAAKAGLAPAMKIVAVSGRRFTPKVMRAALTAGKGRVDPMEMIVQNGDFMTVHKLDYHDGERWPKLERDPSRPDLLTAILSPRTWKPGAAPAPTPPKKSEAEKEREREREKKGKE